jgi:hypothetical protein
MLPGIGGTLFPGQYLTERVAHDARAAFDAVTLERQRRRFAIWWARVEETCGPATGLRALFDLACMPFFGMLGYRARDARWQANRVEVRLLTPGGRPIALIVRPWANQPSGVWREIASAARDAGASWGFVAAPPFYSLLDLQGVVRRAADFHLPAALDTRSFASLWALASAQSLDAGPDGSRIDGLLAAAARYQHRVREDLQQGVHVALAEIARAIGRRPGGMPLDEALTIVYRMLFLLFAESRDLVPRDHPVYAQGYSVATLVRDALADDASPGLWEGLAAITRLSRTGCRSDDLIVHPFNGRLFARREAPSLERHRAPAAAGKDRDRALGRALVALGSRPGQGGRTEIAYADLGVDELGAVYERVLDLPSAGPGRASNVRGSTRSFSKRRKETGTFYTPQPLADFVVRRTLGPLVAGRPPDAILALRVVDPAMGSGAFLVAACRYLAAAYERALVDDGDVTAGDLNERERADIRRVIAERCLVGVDVNPVAVQVARLSLWLATLAEGRPLTFLDHRLRSGNSLIGAWPDDLTRLTGGRARADVTLPLFENIDLDHAVRQTVRPLLDLVTDPSSTLAEVQAKERAWTRIAGPTSPLARWRLACDLWCSRWCAAGWSAAETGALIAAVLRGDRTLPRALLERRIAEADALRQAQGFFHWPLEFADVFYESTGLPRERPGFDAVIGNPPWEMLRRDAASAPPGPARDSLAGFIRNAGAYRCSTGHINLYQPFVERAISLCRPAGRIGLVLPWGVAVDDGAAALRRRLVENGMLESIVGFDNAGALFPIHRGIRFALVNCINDHRPGDIQGHFGLTTSEDIENLGERDHLDTAWPIRLSASTLRRIGGPLLRIPDARRSDELRLVDRWMRTYPPVGGASGWNARFGRELNATDDRRHFGPAGLPIIEGKHIEPFRVCTNRIVHRIQPERALSLLPDARFKIARLGYRDVSSVSNTRSLIAAVLPADVVTTHTIYCLRTPTSSQAAHFLCAVFNSFVMNVVVRLLMGGHVTTSLVEQLPVPVWTAGPGSMRLARLAQRLSRGHADRLAARLEAEVAAMYNVAAADFDRILSGFPLVPDGFKAAARQELATVLREEGRPEGEERTGDSER